jgi:hypothetical protein
MPTLRIGSIIQAAMGGYAREGNDGGIIALSIAAPAENGDIHAGPASMFGGVSAIPEPFAMRSRSWR